MLTKNMANEAFGQFNAAITLNPNYELALFNRGQLLYQYGKHEEAAKDLNKVIQINKRNVQALFYLGNIELTLKRYTGHLVKRRSMCSLIEDFRPFLSKMIFGKDFHFESTPLLQRVTRPLRARDVIDSPAKGES